jgi:uncharacterized protein (TIGR03086 family)
MSEIAERYRRVAATFTERVRNVPADGWDAPSPCPDWTARDVPLHLAGWMPSYLKLDVEVPDDPAGAWEAVDAAVQAALDDPERAKAPFASPMADTFEGIVDAIATTDVLVHTWDLARATGQDDTLDAEAARLAFERMEPMDASMTRGEGGFGARVPVPDDADDQTKLLGFTGRQP